MLKPETMEKLFINAMYKAPDEMCGLLFADETFLLCHNSSTNPRHGFLIMACEHERACKIMGAKPWALVHSHPGKAAALSPKDCLLMNAMQRAEGDDAMAMVIVGLNPLEIRCFTKKGELYNLEWKHEPA